LKSSKCRSQTQINLDSCINGQGQPFVGRSEVLNTSPDLWRIQGGKTSAQNTQTGLDGRTNFNYFKRDVLALPRLQRRANRNKENYERK
jgi:hypothetical protein